MLWVSFVVVVVAIAVGYAFRSSVSGSFGMWASVGVPYLVLAIIAAIRLQRQQVLREKLRFRPGDPSLGIVLGVLLLGGAWLFAKVLLPPGAIRRLGRRVQCGGAHGEQRKE